VRAVKGWQGLSRIDMSLSPSAQTKPVQANRITSWWWIWFWVEPAAPSRGRHRPTAADRGHDSRAKCLPGGSNKKPTRRERDEIRIAAAPMGRPCRTLGNPGDWQ